MSTIAGGPHAEALLDVSQTKAVAASVEREKRLCLSQLCGHPEARGCPHTQSRLERQDTIMDGHGRSQAPSTFSHARFVSSDEKYPVTSLISPAAATLVTLLLAVSPCSCSIVSCPGSRSNDPPGRLTNQRRRL